MPILHKDGNITNVAKNYHCYIYEFYDTENALRGPLEVTRTAQANRTISTAPLNAME